MLPRTKEHRKKLSIASMGNQSAKGAIRSEEYKKKVSKAMTGKRNATGKRSKGTKKRISEVSLRNWQDPEYRKKRLSAPHEHHIHLIGKETLSLTSAKHLQLHQRAYNYLVETGKVNDYIEWFDKQFGLK